MDARHPETKLGPGSYAWSPKWSGGREDRWVTLAVEREGRYEHTIPMILKMYEALGAGEPHRHLLDRALEDLTAYARYKLDGQTGMQYKKVKLNGGRLPERVPVREQTLWAFALAFRVTGDPTMWNATRDILIGYGAGDIGATPGAPRTFATKPYALRQLEKQSDPKDGYVIHALVELYDATGERDYLKMASRVADGISAWLLVNGLFVNYPGGEWARLGNQIPLALVHLEFARSGRKIRPTTVWPRDPYLRTEHEGVGKHWDQVIYLNPKQTAPAADDEP